MFKISTIEKEASGVLVDADIRDVEKILLDENGFLQPVPFSAIKEFSQNQISLFCLKHAVYQIITTELVEFVREQLHGFNKPIEIGAGNGCLGRSLGIPL